MNRRSILPEKYKEIHNYIFELHDILAHIVVKGDEIELASSTFTVENEEKLSQLENNLL